MAAINPYLGFPGNCEEAFNHYKNVFGGEFAMLMRFKDAPPDPAITPAEADGIMHVSLPIGNTVLMGSDRPAAYGPGAMGENISMSFTADSDEHATAVFNGLADGGAVTMPLGKQFWGAYFGMCTDRFGVQWMVSSEPAKEG